MTIIDTRVDQRLIHGIIVNQWNSKLSPKRFMVIDDLVSHQPDVKASMLMAKPVGTGMSIIDTETAINNFKSGKYDKQDVFIIVKEPSTILQLLQNGINIPSVNLGIIFADSQKTAISKFVNLDQKEVDDLKEIEAKGIAVRIQYIPDDPAVDFKAAIRSKKFKQ